MKEEALEKRVSELRAELANLHGVVGKEDHVNEV